MAIKSSNNTEKKERLVSSKEKKIDFSDNSLRPKKLSDYI
jgi:hypothetical protein